MAAKTPTAFGTSGYVDPQRSLYGGVATATNNLLSDVDQHIPDALGLKLSRFHFSDIDDGDTYTSGIPGIVAVAFQAEDIGDDHVAATLTTAATGEITFGSANANSAGWLWVAHRS